MTERAAWWSAGTHLLVEVDDTGNIQVGVRVRRPSAEAPGLMVDTYDRDGYARADVSNVAVLQDLLGKARAFAAAVFPPAEPGRPDLEFTWQERADAYRLLDFHRKIPGHAHSGPGWKTEDNAKLVTAFLRDWGNEQRGLEHPAIPEELDAFAQRWEKWW